VGWSNFHCAGQFNAQHGTTLTLTSPNIQSPYEPQLHELLPTFGHMLTENGYDVVYFGKNHLSKGYFNQTSGQYVHDSLQRYGFHDWNGEPPLGTRGAPAVHEHVQLLC
jgi:choline-sulfatase